MECKQLLKAKACNTKIEVPEKFIDEGRWRDITAYWILGASNNYGSVVLVCAAYDIMTRINPHPTTVRTFIKYRFMQSLAFCLFSFSFIFVIYNN